MCGFQLRELVQVKLILSANIQMSNMHIYSYKPSWCVCHELLPMHEIVLEARDTRFVQGELSKR